MPRPVHFEIHAGDMDRAEAFYTALFGWRFQAAMPGYRLIITGDDEPGINGGMVARQGAAPEPMTAVVAWMCTVDVASVDDYFAKALELGGEVALPKMAIPGVGWLAYVKDTEGNIFGLMQNDPAAR